MFKTLDDLLDFIDQKIRLRISLRLHDSLRDNPETLGLLRLYWMIAGSRAKQLVVAQDMFGKSDSYPVLWSWKSGNTWGGKSTGSSNGKLYIYWEGERIFSVDRRIVHYEGPVSSEEQAYVVRLLVEVPPSPDEVYDKLKSNAINEWRKNNKKWAKDALENHLPEEEAINYIKKNYDASFEKPPLALSQDEVVNMALSSFSPKPLYPLTWGSGDRLFIDQLIEEKEDAGTTLFPVVSLKADDRDRSLKTG